MQGNGFTSELKFFPKECKPDIRAKSIDQGAMVFGLSGGLGKANFL